MKKFLYLLCISMLSSAPFIDAKCSTPSDGKLSCEDAHKCFDCSSADSCECQVTAKSFLSVRPFFEAASPAKLALVRKEMQEMHVNNGSMFQAVPFGGKTLKSDRLAQYFGPSCKRVLTVSSDAASNPDIIAANLGIYTQADETFESVFCLSPEQTFAGLGLNYRTHFGCEDRNKGFFLDLTLPVYYVKNTMNLQERVVNNGGGPLTPDTPANVAQAFKQCSWNAGRIDDDCDTTKVGVSELDIQLGYGWGREQAHMHSYAGVLVPTGNKVNGRKVFEPIIGWNHNTAFHFGSSFGIQIWKDECKDRTLWYELAIDSRYFFENRQCRSFDLKCKPWSRYMQVYTNEAQAQEAADLCASADPADQQAGLLLGTPGINVFTQEVKVRPRFQRTYNTAFALDLKDWTLEGGYNFFTRDGECVKLACPWEELVGIKTERQADGTYTPIDGPALKALTGCGDTNSVQTIGNNFNGENDQTIANYAENIITEDDIDFSSAEAPCMLSNRFYGAVGYSIDICEVRTLIGLGGSYEFSADNTGLDRWGAWAKVALIF
ncbi:MAG: hypothetical protein WD055_04185 [Candidatus Dependentiae bacterium]